MTAVFTSAAALTILSQSSSADTEKSKSAVDNILDIVSGRKTQDKGATSAPKPREVGGMISSEISKAAISAAGASVVNQLQSMDRPIDMKPPEASAENAEAILKRASYALKDYNSGFDSDKVVVSRDEFNADIDRWEADETAEGSNSKNVKRIVDASKRDENYESYKNSVASDKYWKDRNAKQGQDWLSNLQFIFSSMFGKNINVSFGEDGRGKIDAFDLYDGGGQKILSFGDDGSLTTYNNDGSVRSNLAAKDVASMSS